MHLDHVATDYLSGITDLGLMITSADEGGVERYTVAGISEITRAIPEAPKAFT